MTTKHRARPAFSPIEDVVAALAKGEMVIVTDDEDRENEGDLVAVASTITPEQVNFMATHGRGLICAPITTERAESLGLTAMVPRNRESFGTDFTVSVDAASGITTGISAHDRAETLRILADPRSGPSSLVQPGHIFPLQAKPGGVLRRAGHTEAAIDLARLAGKEPAGVICEILNPDGSMARLPELEAFARTHQLKLCTIESLIEFRQEREKLVEPLETRTVQTSAGPFQLHVYRSTIGDRFHLALVRGNIDPEHPVLVRVQRESLIEDLFGPLDHSPKGSTLHLALAQIAKHGSGVLIYMQRDAHALSILESLKAAKGNPRTPMDLRDYGMGAQILFDLGVRKLALISNHPRKIVGLEGHGLSIEAQVPLKGEA